MEIFKNTLMVLAPTFETLGGKIQEMVMEFSRGEGPLKKIAKIFEKYMTEKYLLPLFESLPGKINSVVNSLEGFAKNADKVVKTIENIIYWGKVLFTIIAMITTGFLLAGNPIGWVVSAVLAVGGAFTWLFDLFHLKRSPSLLDLFTGGVLAEGMKGVGTAIDLLAKPIKFIAGLFRKLGTIITDTFNFDNVKETISGFVDWLPGTWGESVDGIKTEMEIASPSKKMEREIINPTFVEPMQSMSAQMPQLVEEVYKEVSFKGPATEMRASLEREKMSQAMAPTNIQNNVTNGANTTTVVEKTHQTVTIPINIGGNEIGTIVADIVEGQIGNISMKGALGLG
jgi:hypothetical protein